MERDNTKIIILGGAFIAYLLKFLFTFWDKDTHVYSFFKYDSQRMTFAAYIDAFADCFTYVIIYFSFFLVFPKIREHLAWIVLVWSGYVLEYYFRYNNPFKIADVFGIRIPLGYSTLAALFLAVVLFIEIYKRLKNHNQWN